MTNPPSTSRGELATAAYVIAERLSIAIDDARRVAARLPTAPATHMRGPVGPAEAARAVRLEELQAVAEEVLSVG